MMELLRFVLSDINVFVGICILLVFFFLIAAMLFDGISSIIKPIVRMRNIKNQGWPPAHCDADGDAVEPDAE